MISQGFHFDVPAKAYHADCCPEPSLSSSVARTLLDQSPAHAKLMHPRLTPQEDVDVMPTRPKEIGTVAHKLILGRGADVVLVDADDYKSKAAQEARKEAYAAGKAPILKPDCTAAERMADAFKAQMALFPEHVRKPWREGRSEVVVAWQEAGGFWCRAMCDRLWIEGDKATLFDVKTTSTTAEPNAASRRIFDAGSDIQAAFYRRGIQAVAPEVRRFESFIVAIEQDPPHGMSVVQLSYESWALAEKKILCALALWERCITTGEWQAYPAHVATADLPAWHEQAWLNREMNDALLNRLDVGRFAKPLPERAAPVRNVLLAG